MNLINLSQLSKSKWLSITILLVAQSSLSEAAQSSKYLMRFKESVAIQSRVNMLSLNSLQFEKHISELDVYVVTPRDAATFKVKELPKLQSSPEILYIEPNSEIRAVDAIPNDPLHPEQTELTRLSVQKAWDINTGSSEVVVSITDTGYDFAHPDLMNRYWINTKEIADNNIDDDANGYVDDVRGWDFNANDNDPTDKQKHGSHVAGIIGAESNNAIGIAGINWTVSMMAAQFLDQNGSGSLETAVLAIVYSANQGARIINASWGSTGSSKAVEDAIKYATSKNALFVVAAGNNGKNSDSNPFFPASYTLPGMITVASSENEAKLSSFSNYGVVRVDVAAPGSNILSTVLDGKWARLSGTSMAAPGVAGVAALILSEKPELNVIDLRNAVLNAVDERETYKTKLTTAGDLNAAKALAQLSEGFQVWPSRMTVNLNDEFQFTAYAPNGVVTWSTSDASLASIDANGKLKALKTGRVNVIAKDAGGQTATNLWVDLVNVKLSNGGGAVGGCSRKSGEPSAADWSLAFGIGIPIMVGQLRRKKRKTREQI